jgi:hypothetical protein
MVAKFRVYITLSGRVSEMSSAHQKRIDKEFNNNKVYASVPCCSVNTILKAIDVHTVDYFSLDVEGGEWSALKSID